MHVLDECLGHPAELEFAAHVRKLVEAALFVDDKSVLMNALYSINHIDIALDGIRRESIGRAPVAIDIDGIDWASLEDQCEPFDAMQHLLEAAKFKLEAAIEALDE